MKKAQENILPHREAKLNLYNEYLKIYLRIIALSPIETINIYDLFCGTGIYEDGKKGSPIIAFESIKSMYYYIKSIEKKQKNVNLIVNDIDVNRVNNVKVQLDEKNSPPVCNIIYANYDARDAFNRVIEKTRNQASSNRNLIFLDPYGYKDIHKKDIEDLLLKKRTEILLFLPISFMHRFTGIAVEDYDNPSYEKLRDFLAEFFDTSHPIRRGAKMNVMRYIKYVEDSLTFEDSYYTASFYIQRDNANYFAVFYITPNIRGLEKFLEVEWAIDSDEGSGFRNEQTIYLFQNVKFEEDLLDFISINEPDNISVYEFVLKQKHKLKHANEVLKSLLNGKKIEIIDVLTNSVTKRGFYLNYDNYIKKIQKVKFTKISNG